MPSALSHPLDCLDLPSGDLGWHSQRGNEEKAASCKDKSKQGTPASTASYKGQNKI